MKEQEKWWEALCGWLERHQGGADLLFVYDKERGQLERCFDKSVALRSVDAAGRTRLYQAAEEGHLGLLRPDDLKPQLLSTDPVRLFAAKKEPAVEKSAPVTVERPKVKAPVVERLHAAEEFYRQTVYAPKKKAHSTPESGSDELEEMKARVKRAAALEQAAQMLRNILPEEEMPGEVQMQLAADLAQLMPGTADPEEQDEERRRRERRARAELLNAQHLFIWASASDVRDRRMIDAQMKYLDEMSQWLWTMEVNTWKPLMNMTQELYSMTTAGAGDAACNEKIRSYLDGEVTGERPEVQPQPQQTEPEPEKPRVSPQMLGNALLRFCRFAAGEVPLSVRHVQVAAHCRQLLQQMKRMNISMAELGLDAQEQAAVQGTVEMGVLIDRGLRAQAALTSGQRLADYQYRSCLQSYLAMKGVEETLVPHVQSYQKELRTGNGPVSAMQILMANPGFRAGELRAKAGKTAAMERLARMDPRQVAQMITEGRDEMAAMGRQVMIAACQMSDGEAPTRQVNAQQKGGPLR